MTFGITKQGFNLKRFEDIKAEIVQDLTNALGGINTLPDSVFGQIIGVFTKALTEVWEVEESVYNSQYPASAYGVSLDDVGDLVGVTRLPATSTIAIIQMEGTEGATITLGSQISVDGTGEIFEIQQETKITASKSSGENGLHKTRITLDTTGNDKALDNQLYRMTINGNDYDHTSGVGDDIINVQTDLISKIDAGESLVNATTGDTDAEIVCTTTSFTMGNSFSLVVNPVITIDKLWTPAIFDSLTKGNVSAPINSLTIIETPVAGWNECTNLSDVIEGREIESDDEFRNRRAESLVIGGRGTVDAIRARVKQNVEDVIQALVFENETDVLDTEGRPPHSLEVVVEGGNDTEIAQEIWESKPAGIQTFGTESEAVIDSQGGAHTIYFSRPTPQYCWVDVVLTLNPEETFPSDGLDRIAQNILTYGDTLQIGEDVLTQKFFAEIFKVAGVASAVVETALTVNPTAPPAPVFSVANKSVDEREIALFDLTRITVA